MADGGAASQDESSGPGNDYSILHIHTHIQTVLVARYRDGNADQTEAGSRMDAGVVRVEFFLHPATPTVIWQEEETSYCGATANYMETCLPPFVWLDVCTPLHIHTSADKRSLAYFISNRRRGSAHIWHISMFD